MKLRIFYLFLLGVIGVFSSCEKDSLPSLPEPEPAPEVAGRTVLAYIAADNTLTDFSLLDLNEMIQGMEAVDTKTNNMLVYIDRKEKTSGYAYRAIEPRLIRICRDVNSDKIMLDTLKTYEVNRNSAGAEEIREVLSYAFNYFPAQGYGLILWSHGEGWIPFKKVDTRWIGQDTDAGAKDKRLDIDDLHWALQGLPHLDYIFSDACYMSSIEVAYEWRGCADYFIGSPTEIPGPGAPYQKVVPALFAREDAAAAIVTAYYDYYEAIYNPRVEATNESWTGGVSLSVLRSDKLDALAEATRKLPLYTSGRISVGGIKCYDPLRSKYYYDLDGMVKSLVGEGVLYQDWKQAYEAVVFYKKTTPMNLNTDFSGNGYLVSMEGFTGVATYILANGKSANLSNYYNKLAWYIDTMQ